MIIKEVMLYFLFVSVTRLIRGEQMGIKSAGTMDSAEMSIIYGTTKIIDAPDQIR